MHFRITEAVLQVQTLAATHWKQLLWAILMQRLWGTLGVDVWHLSVLLWSPGRPPLILCIAPASWTDLLARVWALP